jgi:siroheme decarboxylase
MTTAPAIRDIDYRLDETDRRIIRATQAGLPICPRPYQRVADDLGLDARELMSRMQAMQAAGVIRRIAAVPNHYRLGFRANGMSVWDVLDDRLGELGPKVGELACVSHCYHRPRRPTVWPYNLFAMVHGRTRDEVAAAVESIAALLGDACRGHDVLFSSEILKKTGLRLSQSGS